MSNLANLARSLKSYRGALSGAAGGGALALPALILMTDGARLADPGPAIARLPDDAMVLFRHYGDPEREAKAKAVLALCRRRRLRMLVAGDWRLAARIGADGLHLPEALVGRARGRRWRPDCLLTAAAHGARAILRAERAGVDAVLLSPVFESPSHPGAACLGPLRFARLAGATPLPVYALGGINARTAPRLRHSGAAGLAGIGAFL